MNKRDQEGFCVFDNNIMTWVLRHKVLDTVSKGGENWASLIDINHVQEGWLINKPDCTPLWYHQHWFIPNKYDQLLSFAFLYDVVEIIIVNWHKCTYCVEWIANILVIIYTHIMTMGSGRVSELFWNRVLHCSVSNGLWFSVWCASAHRIITNSKSTKSKIIAYYINAIWAILA